MKAIGAGLVEGDQTCDAAVLDLRLCRDGRLQFELFDAGNGHEVGLHRHGGVDGHVRVGRGNLGCDVRQLGVGQRCVEHVLGRSIAVVAGGSREAGAGDGGAVDHLLQFALEVECLRIVDGCSGKSDHRHSEQAELETDGTTLVARQSAKERNGLLTHVTPMVVVHGGTMTHDLLNGSFSSR